VGEDLNAVMESAVIG